jgi:hypothetical protein
MDISDPDIKAYLSMKDQLPKDHYAVFQDGQLLACSPNKMDVLKKITNDCYLVCVGHENEIEVCKV